MSEGSRSGARSAMAGRPGRSLAAEIEEREVAVCLTAAGLPRLCSSEGDVQGGAPEEDVWSHHGRSQSSVGLTVPSELSSSLRALLPEIVIDHETRPRDGSRPNFTSEMSSTTAGASVPPPPAAGTAWASVALMLEMHASMQRAQGEVEEATGKAEDGSGSDRPHIQEY